MSNEVQSADLLLLTTEIVAAHVGKNSVPAAELSGLIRSVHEALAGLGRAKAVETPAAAARPEPAVPISRSVRPDHIVCLEDGRKLKMLKRHLQTAYAMTPDEYRQRWGLPSDYPMVAPAYAKRRSELAKSFGLGTTRHARKKR
jgi:predicted transcriptional regulator